MKFKKDSFNSKLFYQKNFEDYLVELFSHSLINRDQVPVRDNSGITYYKKNSMGYRNNEFLKKENMVVAGCSFTYGLGLSEELTWADILANKIDEKYVNLAHPGLSIEQSIINVISYCEKFGNPKYIFCLFPPLHRLTIPNTEMLVSKPTSQYLDENLLLPAIGTNQVNEDLKKSKYFKTPIDYTEILEWQISYYINLRHIRFLESFCKSAGIKLFWTQWDIAALEIIDKLQGMENVKFDYYVDLNKNNFESISQQQNAFIGNIKNFDEYKKNYFKKEYQDKLILNIDNYLDCHNDFYEKYFDQFVLARDFEFGLAAVHPGAHYNIHIAEIFYDFFKDQL
jgi:hypothetical protein